MLRRRLVLQEVSRRRARLPVALAVALALTAACRTRQTCPNAPAITRTPTTETAPPLDYRPLREIAYEKTLRKFERAVFLKPPSVEHPSEEITLAPILVYETASAADASSQAGDGARVSKMEWSRRVVELSGKPRQQLSYAWRHAGPDADSSEAPAVRGIRLTLDEDGMPVIAEVSDGGPLARVFVSDRLESLAREAFGPPLPGRRYSIEPPVESHPDHVVARVLSDGPVPMGPIVYVEVEGQSITTLICRCMPSQAAEFVVTAYYEMGPTAGAPDGGSSVFDASADQPDRLATCLRLPPEW